MTRTHNLIHRSDLLHQDAGTFFHHYYEDAERVFALFDSYCWSGQLMLEEALDAARLFYRQQIPALHRDLFFPVTITEQEYLEGKYRMVYYGDEAVRYGQGIQYGMPSNDIAGAVYLPEGITDLDLCTDTPVDPTVILLKGVDFDLRGGYLVFRQNLFDLFASEGREPDRTCTFWLRSAYSDRHYIQNRLGVLTRTYGTSVESYLRFCNLILDSVIEGTSAIRLTQIVCRSFDVPCTEETETVEVIDTAGVEACLVTDKHVYFLPAGANFIHSAGETLPPGTILADSILMAAHKELPDGQPLFLERRFLGRDYLAGLTFPNENVRVFYNEDMTKASFPITGREEDIERFWQDFYERAVDTELASEAALGGWINPAKFIYENVLYPRVRFFQIDVSKTGKEKLPMVNTKILRSLIPPGVLFSLHVAVPTVNEMETCFTVTGAASSPSVGLPPVRGRVVFSAEASKIRAC